MAYLEARRSFLKSIAVGGAATVLAGAAARKQRQPSAKAEPAPPIPAKKTPIKLGLASYTFRKFDLDKTLAMTRRVGLENICLKSFHLPLEASPDEIAKVATRIKEAGLNLYSGGVITMRDKAQTDQAFDYARAAGMKMIIASPAHEMLALINEKIQQSGIAVAIHNHGPGDKLYPTPESVYEKVKALDKRIGLCIDIGHTFRIGADPIRSAELYADRLLDVHMKDISAPTPEGRETEVGRGAIDIVLMLKTLLKIKYSGVVSFEYENDPDDPLAGLAESVGYVRGVLAAI